MDASCLGTLSICSDVASAILCTWVLVTQISLKGSPSETILYLKLVIDLFTLSNSSFTKLHTPTPILLDFWPRTTKAYPLYDSVGAIFLVPVLLYGGQN